MMHPIPGPIVVPDTFPITWQDPADAALYWTLDRLHCPDPLPALTFDYVRMIYAECMPAAAVAYEMPIAVKARRAFTYFYWTVQPVVAEAGETEARDKRAQALLRETMAHLQELWHTTWLPEVKEHLAFFDAFDLAGASLPELLAHLDEGLARVKRLWVIHFLVVNPALIAASTFGDLYLDLHLPDLGIEGDFEAYVILQGFDNKTLEANRGMWHLSRVVLATAEVHRVFETTPANRVAAALAEFPAGWTFLEELQAYLAEYGQRDDYFDELSQPCWIEDPTPVFENLQDYIRQPDRDPLKELAVQAAERERVTAGSRQFLIGYPQPVISEFEFYLKAAQEAMVLLEDHNFWIDYKTKYQLRRLLLEFGRRCTDAGVLLKANDVFHLSLQELRETMAGLPGTDHRDLVQARRAEVTHYATVNPPNALGSVPEAPLPNTLFTRSFLTKVFGIQAVQSEDPNVILGNAGSPGTVRGPACVVHSPDEAGKLQKGEILIAETTSPPWTSMFATAAAIVTDVGGILSHCAIVAREYRIPAVVGTGIATTVIHDGQMLEVDGTAGEVRILTSE
ncbi:MAG: hypothetical protein EXR62_08055 [Chloroflexi bacterium]|nr:hypothetical protein [Chloroflexota bacterium]